MFAPCKQHLKTSFISPFLDHSIFYLFSDSFSCELGMGVLHLSLCNACRNPRYIVTKYMSAMFASLISLSLQNLASRIVMPSPAVGIIAVKEKSK